MEDEREDRRREIVLRPGIVLPVMGYAAYAALAIAAVVVVASPGAPNHSLQVRWIGGKIVMLGAWCLYKMGSQRIVLGSDTMRIIGFIFTWNVRRGGVREIALSPGPFSVVIVLEDGSLIEPMMFMTTRPGQIYLRAGLFGNAMSRQDISAQVTEWKAAAPPDPGADARPLAWRTIRTDLILLLGLSVVVAAEAIALTAANIWLGRPAPRRSENVGNGGR